MATRVNAGKWSDIHINVQTQAMVATAFSDSQPEGCDLSACNIDTRRILSCHCLNAAFAEEINNRSLDTRDQGPSTDSQPFDIDKQVAAQLPRAMLGYLSATI